VEFSNPVKAKVLTAYGNATQPGSKHKGDQLELFSKKQMRDAWRTRSEVEAHLESKVTIP
jgi:acyl-homoserine-lactone acylase